jgi:hypothetical protein
MYTQNFFIYSYAIASDSLALIESRIVKMFGQKVAIAGAELIQYSFISRILLFKFFMVVLIKYKKRRGDAKANCFSAYGSFGYDRRPCE